MRVLLSFTSLIASILAESSEETYKEWIIPVALFDSMGPPSQNVLHNNDKSFLRTSDTNGNMGVMKSNPPRYSIGALEVVGPQIEANRLKPSSNQHFFTFDLGNPSQTIFLTENCKGCLSSLEPTSGCPKIVPECNDEYNENISFNMAQDGGKQVSDDKFCWPSHPGQYLPEESYRYVLKDCPLKKGKDQNAGTLDSIPVCIACFDGGDHSRFYSFAETDFHFVGATQKVRDRNNVLIEIPAPKIKHFQFGALVRTVPLRDRIWSNIGIGANSSFMEQLPAHSFMFDFDYYGVKRNRKNGEEIIFNPDPKRYSSWAKSPYVIQHQRHHVIERIYFGSKIVDAPSNIDFFMDTGNDGISIHDSDLIDFLAKQTVGQWLQDTTDPNNYGVSRLFVPYSRADAPTLTIVLSPGIAVTLPGYAWVFDDFVPDTNVFKEKDEYEEIIHKDGMSPTIFVMDDENILGLPFLTAPGYSFVFEDLDTTLHIGYDWEASKQMERPLFKPSIL